MNLVVADLGDVELVVAEAAADGGDEGVDLLVGEDAVDAGLLDVEDLAAEWEDGLGAGVAALHRGAAGGVALDEEELAFVAVAGGAVLELAEELAELLVVVAGHLAGLAGGEAGALGADGLGDDGLGDLGVLVEVVLELGAHEALDDAGDVGVAELGLGLALELGVGDLDGDDADDALADVLAGEVLLALLEELVCPGVVVHHAGEGGAEAGEVGAALDGVDVVGEGEDRLVVLLVDVLQGDLGGDAVLDALHGDHLGAVAGQLRVAHGGVGLDGGAALGDGADEADDAVLVVVGLLLAGVLVGEVDRDAGVEEGELLEALGEDVPLEVVGVALVVVEDLLVEVEGDGGAGLLGGAGADDLEGLGDVAAGEAHAVDLAVAADLDLEPVGEGVHAGDADAVEAAGDLVAAVSELAAGVQDREDDLDGGAVLGGVHVDGDAAAVVANGAGAVGVERDVDVRAEAGHGLVDRVVDDLVDAVVVAALEGVADVHGGALADGLHALEDLDLAGAVVLVLGDVGGGTSILNCCR